jgi:hypothetical protein
MKVSDLIKILEEHKDKDLYHLNIGNPIEVKTLNHHIVNDCFFLEMKGSHDFRFVSEMESIDDGFTPRLRTEQEMDLYTIQQKREGRQFNYYFPVGSEVMIDEEVLFDFHKEQLSHLIGLKGIVKKSESNFHAYGQGKSYAHVVEWENGTKTQDTDWIGEEDVEYDEKTFMPKNYLSTIFLKEYIK